MPPPRPPGSVVVARFGPGEPALRFRVLAEQTRGLERPPSIAVAEDAAALADLWRAYELQGAPPSVDFAQDLALAFSEGGFCNDGHLEGFALTSAGEVVPRVFRTEQWCDLVSYGDCPAVRVYVAALGRAALPPGDYRFRGEDLSGFVVRSPAPAAGPALSPPPEPAAPAPRHPRRARVIHGGAEEELSLAWARSGVWIRSDAVWVLEAPGSGWTAAEDAKQRVCDREACTRVLARTSCWAPECPATGTLLFAERPLGVREPWPTEPVAWERLARELAADPELAVMLGGQLSYPRPAPARAGRVGWAQFLFERGIELAASADAQRTFAGDAALGPGARVGWHFNWAVEDTTTQGKIFEPLVGDGWGVDLRLAALRAVEGSASSGVGLRAGLGLSATNAIGLGTDESRVRVASLLGVVLPEVGLVRLPGASVRFFTTNALPVSLLLSPRLALEVRPALSVLFGSGGPEGMLSLSVGLMWRTRESLCPDPPRVRGAEASSCFERSASRVDQSGADRNAGSWSSFSFAREAAARR